MQADRRGRPDHSEPDHHERLPGGGFVTTWTDVSEHHRLKTQLTRNDALVAQIVNHLPQGISLFDENLSLQLWNEAFAAVLEFPPQALFRGARFEDLLALMAERGDYGPGDPGRRPAPGALDRGGGGGARGAAITRMG